MSEQGEAEDLTKESRGASERRSFPPPPTSRSGELDRRRSCTADPSRSLARADADFSAFDVSRSEYGETIFHPGEDCGLGTTGGFPGGLY